MSHPNQVAKNLPLLSLLPLLNHCLAIAFLLLSTPLSAVKSNRRHCFSPEQYVPFYPFPMR